MKLIQFFLILLCTAGAANATPPAAYKFRDPDPKTLANDPRFKEFAYDFIGKFRHYADFYPFPKMKNREEFLSQVQSCDQEIETVHGIFSSFNIDFEEAMERKAEVDNQLLRVLTDFPELQELEEDRVWEIVSSGIDLVVKNPENEMYVQKALPPGEGAFGKSVTVEEIWECLKKAAGLGAASILSIAALQKLAQEGVQKIVSTVAKALAKKAGWFGALMMVAEFSVCIYAAYEDDPTDS